MTDEDEPHYELVMPFVTVRSNGGVHDDDSYAAGWDMGALDAQLASREPFVSKMIRTENIPQADLIAMKNGYSAETAPTDIEGWSTIDLHLTGETND